MDSKKLVKQYKVTCTGCGNLTFRPYVDFDTLRREEQNETIGKKVDKGIWNTLLIGGTSMACLPLGCCVATDTAQQKAKRDWPTEKRIKDYCDAFMCKKCHSTALKIEVTEDYV